MLVAVSQITGGQLPSLVTSVHRQTHYQFIFFRCVPIKQKQYRDQGPLMISTIYSEIWATGSCFIFPVPGDNADIGTILGWYCLYPQLQTNGLRDGNKVRHELCRGHYNFIFGPWAIIKVA